MATIKKTATVKKKRTPSKKAKAEIQPKSFRAVADTKPFMSFKLTQQTVYWLILLAFITVMTLWILKLQIDVVNILDNLNLK